MYKRTRHLPPRLCPHAPFDLLQWCVQNIPARLANVHARKVGSSTPVPTAGHVAMPALPVSTYTQGRPASAGQSSLQVESMHPRIHVLLCACLSV
jgi:hypothetical protein